MTQPSGGVRSLFERMTNPVEQDLEISSRLQALQRGDVMKIVDNMCQVMEHLAHQRDDVTVERIISEDGRHGFTVLLAKGVPAMPGNPLIPGLPRVPR